MPDYHWRQKREDQLRESSVNRATLCALVAQREDDKRDLEARIAELEGREITDEQMSRLLRFIGNRTGCWFDPNEIRAALGEDEG